MDIIIIFIAVMLVLLVGMGTALVMTIKGIIKVKQELKLTKQRENAYQHYIEQEALIDEKFNAAKNEIISGDVNELFNQHFGSVSNNAAEIDVDSSDGT